MLGHFGVRFKVFGRGFDSRGWYGRKKNFFLHFFFDFAVLGTFCEILVLGSILGVGKVNFFHFVSIWRCWRMSIDKKDVVVKPLRGG